MAFGIEDVDAIDDRGNQAPLIGVTDIRNARKTVCQFWIDGLCQKGEQCGYLHEYVLERMPTCRDGLRCPNMGKGCNFQHKEDEECAFYAQGFCYQGKQCKFRHVKRTPDQVPEVADFSTTLDMFGDGDEAVRKRRRMGGPNSDRWKVTLCKYFKALGKCQFGKSCHFAHGEEELRRPDGSRPGAFAGPRGGGGGPGPGPGPRGFPPGGGRAAPAAPPGGAGLGASGSQAVNYAAAMRDLRAEPEPLPVREGEALRCFVMQAASPAQLTQSVGSGLWGTSANYAPLLNDALRSGARVLFAFACRDAGFFMGLAEMAAPIRRGAPGEQAAPPFAVRWLRTCNLPFPAAEPVRNDLDRGASVVRARDCQELAPAAALQLITLLYRAPRVEVAGAAAPGAAAAGGAGPGPGDGPMLLKVQRGEGFVFGCTTDMIGECYSRALFGAPRDYEEEAKCVQPGSVILLFDVQRQDLYGVFEATAPAQVNADREAWNKSGAAESPYPVQVRVRCIFEGDVLNLQDAGASQLLAPKMRGRGPMGVIGALPEQTAWKLANYFVQRKAK